MTSTCSSKSVSQLVGERERLYLNSRTHITKTHTTFRGEEEQGKVITNRDINATEQLQHGLNCWKTGYDDVATRAVVTALGRTVSVGV